MKNRIRIIFFCIVILLLFSGSECDSSRSNHFPVASVHEYITSGFEILGKVSDDSIFVIRDIVAFDFDGNATTLEIGVDEGLTLIALKFIDGYVEYHMIDGIPIPAGSELCTLLYTIDGDRPFVQLTLDGTLE